MMKKIPIKGEKAMANMGNKKLALLYILKILEEYTDFDHRLTQSEIADKLEQQYGVILERKAISRNLSLLREAGYEVESERNGNYLDERVFDNSELRLVIDGVLSSRYITEKQAKDLASRIAALSNKHFNSHVKHIHLLSNHEKTENNTVFYAIELIDEAIDAGLQISFDYYHLDDTLKMSKKRRITVSPIQMLVKNQFYYLLACEEWNVFGRAAAEKGGAGKHPVITCYRLDLLSNPIIEDVKASVDIKTLIKNGEEPNPKDFLRTHPYMHSYGHATQRASFLCYQEDLDLVVETLGTDIKVKKIKPCGSDKPVDPSVGLVKVELKIDLNELIEFACRYPQKIFLTSPQKAVNRQKELYDSHNKIMEMIREYDF